ncbi:MAG: sulfatase-like hydrolase/transferase [Deltaproteobacteria bacterium]|nr:sulfatase-like hydrolase/transferase [Deltaproteobacteria bacterium]
MTYRWKLVPEALVLGFATGIVSAVADLVALVLRADVGNLSVLEHVEIALHLVAIYLPVGLGLGIAGAVLLAIARRTRALDGPGRYVVGEVPWLRWAPGPAAAIAGAGVFVVGVGASAFLAGRTGLRSLANVELLPGVLALVLPLGAVAAGLLAGLVAAIVRRLSRRIRPLGVPAHVLLGFLVLIGAGLGAFVALRIHWLRSFDALKASWGVVPPVLYLLLLVLWRRTGTRRRRRGVTPPRGRTQAIFAVLAVVVSAGAISASGSVLERHRRIRSAVDRGSPGATRVLRTYARNLDIDSDGYPFLFGERDCDDGDATIHPGAPDPPGDGVDQDCFAGDGTPPLGLDSDGAMAAVPAEARRPSIVFVTADALAPSHLGIFGYRRATSARIDQWAKTRAVRFANAYTPTPRTSKAIPAMLTGLYASELSLGTEYMFATLNASNVLVSEQLQEAGYATGAFVGTSYLERYPNFFQGFGTVRQSPTYKEEPSRAVELALAWARTQPPDKPFFLWIHLFNTHEPYLQPPYPNPFGERPVDRYDAEVRRTDLLFGRVLRETDRMRAARKMVVILASDHGESFGEHGAFGHGSNLYEESLRSVLMIEAPGATPRAVHGRVGLHDIGPTLANLAGLRMPRRVHGRSLAPSLFHGREPVARPLFAEIAPDGFFSYDQRAALDGRWKLLWNVRDGAWELYDLTADPGEQRNLVDERPDEVERLQGLMRRWVGSVLRRENTGEQYVAMNRLARVPRMSHPLSIAYERFDLLGVDIPRTRVRRGEVLAIDFYYRVRERIRQDLWFDVQFRAPPGVSFPEHFHAAHTPLLGFYHTFKWRPGELLRDPVRIVIPNQLSVPLTLPITLLVQSGQTTILPETGRHRSGLVEVGEITIAP